MPRKKKKNEERGEPGTLPQDSAQIASCTWYLAHPTTRLTCVLLILRGKQPGQSHDHYMLVVLASPATCSHRLDWIRPPLTCLPGVAWPTHKIKESSKPSLSARCSGYPFLSERGDPQLPLTSLLANPGRPVPSAQLTTSIPPLSTAPKKRVITNPPVFYRFSHLALGRLVQGISVPWRVGKGSLTPDTTPTPTPDWEEGNPWARQVQASRSRRARLV